MRYVHLVCSWATLPCLLWASSTAVSASLIDVDQVVAELQPHTDLPIWVPDEIPQMDEVHFSLDISPDAY